MKLAIGIVGMLQLAIWEHGRAAASEAGPTRVERSRAELWDLLKDYSFERERGNDRDIARAQQAIDEYLMRPGDNSEVVYFWV